MSRFNFDEYDGEGVPYEIWEQQVSNALGGRRGQEALAEMETALLALPEPKLVYGHLAANGAVCAIGAFVAHKKAQAEGADIAAVIEAMSAGVRCECGHALSKHNGPCTGTDRRWGAKAHEEIPCSCTSYEPDADEEHWSDTTQAGQAVGLKFTVAWHLAYLNDEKFRSATPEERYEQMLAWVRRAQGKAAPAEEARAA